MKKFLLLYLITIFNTLNLCSQVSISGKKPAIVHDWSWITKEEGTRISTSYPEKVTYYRYESHPEYRVIWNEAYDSNGILVGKLNFGGLSNEEALLREIQEDYVLQTSREAFKRDKYGFSRESLGAKNYVKYRLGLIKQRPKCSHDDIKVAERYLEQLSMDNIGDASVIDQIIRVTDTSFAVCLRDADDMPGWCYLIEYTNNGKYESKHTIRMTDDFIEGTLEGTEAISEIEVRTKSSQINNIAEQTKETLPSAAMVIKEEAPEFLPCTYKVGRKKVNNTGGMEGVQRYLWDHIKYPDDALEKGIQGKVFVSFVIDVDGSVTDVRVKRSVHPSLDREAVRVVSSMPKWKPGTQDGKPVRVTYTVNVPFKTMN